MIPKMLLFGVGVGFLAGRTSSRPIPPGRDQTAGTDPVAGSDAAAPTTWADASGARLGSLERAQVIADGIAVQAAGLRLNQGEDRPPLADEAATEWMEALDRFPESAVLPRQGILIAREMQRLAAGTIGAILDLPDVQGALDVVRRQTGKVRQAAAIMRSTAERHAAEASSIDAATAIGSIATVFTPH